ncbi:MAG: T9SS type A sorting domain-containing protein [candidate division KSB1 bacterium]|nr:T9SS type A sorting domain-containing protein [candidate division KSB1 bacterium]
MKPTQPPNGFTLDQNYPNPFNPVTSISFTLDKAGHTRLAIYDLLGHEIKELINQTMSAGTHRIRVDAESLPTGVYLYQLQSAGQSMTKKMTVLK